MPYPLTDMLGNTYGKFVVVRIGNYVEHKRHWILKCQDCGYEKSWPGTDIRRGFLGEKCDGCREKRSTATTKECSDCKKVLPKSDYYANKDHYDLLAVCCKVCSKKRRKVIIEMISGAKKRAKKKGISFNLTGEFLKELNTKQQGKCVYTGLSLDWDYCSQGEHRYIKGQNAYRASLDRIDSSKGYTQDNVQLVVYIVNMIKNAFTEKEFLENCLLIVENARASGKL